MPADPIPPTAAPAPAAAFATASPPAASAQQPHEPQAHEQPTDEDTSDALLAARFGDTDDLRAFASRFGPAALQRATDPNGNTLLHMAAANGHTGAPPPSPLPTSPFLLYPFLTAH